MANNLIDALSGLGLIDPSTAKAGNSLQRVTQAVQPIVRKPIEIQNTTNYERGLDQEISYLDEQKRKYDERMSQGLFLTGENLTSNNILIRGATNAANLGGRVLGGVGDAVMGLYALDRTAEANKLRVPDDVYAIHQKQKKGEALSPEEESRLNAKLDLGNNLQDDLTQQSYGGLGGSETPTYAEVIAKQEGLRDNAQWATSLDLRGKLSNKITDEPFNESLGDLATERDQWEAAKDSWGKGEYKDAIGQTWDSLTGASGQTLGALKENPFQLANMVADTLPYLMNKTANVAFAGDAGRIFSDGVNTVADRDGVQSPSMLETGGVMGATAGYTALNYLERVTLLKALNGKLPTTGAGSVASNLSSKITSALPQAVQNAGKYVPTGILATAAGNTLKAVGTEAVAEGFQQQIEDSWSKLETDFNLVDNTVAATMGGVMGGAFSAPGTVRQIGADVMGKRIQNAQEEQFAAPTVEDADLVNPESPSFAPEKAINRIIADMNKPDVDLGDVHARSKTIRDDVYAAYETSERTVQDAKNPEAFEQEFAAKRAAAEEFFAANDETHPAWNVAKSKSEANQVEYEQRKAAIEGVDLEVLEGARDKFKDKLDKVDSSFKQIDDYYRETQPKTNEGEVDEVTSILNAPSFDNVARMKELAEDVNLPEATRTTMRIVSDALIAQNRAKTDGDVSNAVLKGTDGFRGLDEYLKLTQEAVSTGNAKVLTSLGGQIQRFEKNLASKVEASQQAQALADSTGKKIQVVRNNDGTWYANEGAPIPSKEFKKNNGLIANPHRIDGTGGLDTLLNAMRNNLEAVRTTSAAMTQLSSVPQEGTNTEPQAQTAPDVNTDPNEVPSTTETYPTPEVYPPDADVPATPNPYVDPEESPFAAAEDADVALDQLNADERATSRDTAFRDSDPKARTVGKAETVKPTAEAKPKAEVKTEEAPKAKRPLKTKEEATTILEGKYSADTHEVFQRTDGGYGVRAKKMPESDIQVEVTEEAAADMDVSPEGAISSLDTQGKTYKESIEAERAKEFQDQNLVKTGFTQRLKQGLNSPLVAIKNFVSGLNKNDVPGVIAKFTGEIPKDSQIAQVNDFLKFNKYYGPTVQNLIEGRDASRARFRNESYIEFLLNEQGELDVNTVTAINAVTYAWLGENATKTMNDARSIGSALGAKNLEMENIPYDIFNRMAYVGTHQNTLAASLGERIMQALQVRTLKDVDPVRKSLAEQALGTTAIAALLDAGLVERTGILNTEMQTMREEIGVKDSNVDTVDDGNKYTLFIRPTMVKAGQYYETIDVIRSIGEKTADTQGVMASVFGFQPFELMPSLTPDIPVVDSFNSHGSTLSDMAKETIKKQQETPYVLNQDMLKILDAFMDKAPSNLLAVLGKKDPEQVHAAFKHPTISVNEGIERSLGIMSRAREYIKDKPFYLPMTMWVNNRSGYDTAFNPQGDKIHRAVASLEADKITVPTDKPIFENGELTQYGLFLKALALRMEDVKIPGTGAVDKTLNEKFLPVFEAYILSPEVQAMAENVTRIKTGTATPTQFREVGDLLTEWDMGAIGLSALNAIADMKVAKEKGKSFTAVIAGESDGVTNGPAITHTMLNTGTDEMLRSVGVIPKVAEGELQITNMAQYRDGKGKDLYEQLAALQKVYWGKMERGDNPIGHAMNALDFLDNSYGERKGAKRALTPFNYGSGMAAVNRSNASGTLDAVYKLIQNTVLGNGTATAEELTFAINALIRADNMTNRRNTPYIERHEVMDMSKRLPPKVERAIKDADIALRGAATEAAMKDMMADYIDTRDTITQVANTAYELYSVVRARMGENALEAYNESGNPSNNGVRFTEGLSADMQSKVDRESQRFMPSVATPMGIHSGNAASASIPLLNTTYKWNADKKIQLKTRKIKFTYTPESSLFIRNMQAKKLREDKSKSSTFESYAREVALDSPGVGAMALFIQSHDAYITFRTMLETTVQNFHDANSTNAYNLINMAKIQNKAFLDAVTISHAGKAFSTALIKPLRALMDEKVNLNVADRIDMASALIKTLDKAKMDLGSFEASLPALVSSMYAKDVAKMERMASIHAINQYGTEGGEILLDSDIRKEIGKRKATLLKAQERAVAEATEIGKWMDANIALGTKDTNKKPVKSDEAVTPKSKSKEAIAQSMEQTLYTERERLSEPSQLFKHLVQTINPMKSSEGSAGVFANQYTQLISLFGQVLPENTKVNIMNSTENPSDVMGMEEAIKDNKRAWYAEKNGRVQINIRVGTGTEVKVGDIVHEIIHASTAYSIKQVRNNPSKHPKAKETLDKLDRLYESVKSKVTSSDHEMVKYGVTNLDEFIATGLVYPKFINYLDSVTDIPVEKRGKNRITTAFRSMVSNLLELMQRFKGRTTPASQKTVTAYEALIMDTAEFVSRARIVKEDTSDTDPTILGAPHAHAVDEVAEYTAKQVYDALDDGKLDPVFKAQLGRNISDITDRMFSGRVQKFARTTQGYSPEQIWNAALESGKAPYMTKAIAAGFAMSAQEQFGLEAIEVALTHTMGDKSLMQSFGSMDRAFVDAKKKLTVESFYKGNWNDASTEEKAIAKSKYDYVFRTDRKDYLTRFVSLSIANKEFNELLDIAASKRVLLKSERPSFEGMMKVLNKAVEGVMNKLSTAENILAINRKLPELAKDLVNLDLKGRNKVVNKIESAIYDADAVVHAKIGELKEVVAKKADELPTMNLRIARIVTNTLKTTQGSGMFSVFDTLADFRNQDNNNTRLGFLGELNNEIKDNSTSKKLAERLINFAKQNEGNAARIKSLTKTDMLAQFANDGKNLTLEDRVALSYVGLRTDMQSLLDTYSVAELKELLEKPAMLDKAIAKYEKEVRAVAYSNRTKDLAWYMVSGVGTETLAKNAAAVVGATTREGLVESIDKLASLYAIKYSDKDHIKRMAAVMDSELSRRDGNGIQALLTYHKTLVNDSRKVLFADNPLSMVKGYLPDITNPHKDVVIATTKADKERLGNAFYTKVGSVGKSPNDVRTDESVMYYSEDAGKQRIISGAMALFNYGRRGTEVPLEPQEVTDIANRASSQISNDPNYDPRENNTTSMIPSYDQYGRVTAYNYEMSARVRDQYLERNNDFSDLMGAFTSLGYTKVETSKQNMVVVDQLHKDYKENFSKDPKRYIYVSYNSTDPVIYNAWDKLPHETKEYVKQTWGRYGMYVSNDAFLTIFGTPKMTITKAFDKDPAMRNMAESAFIGLMKILFGENARVRAASGERIWQEGVAIMKNFIVIRNVTTLVMNMASNIFLLAAHGVKPSHIVRDTLKSIKGGMQYRRDMTNITRLQNKQRTNPEQADAIQEEINRLQVSIERNPLKEFIDQGMFAGIVEDVDPSQDMYSYQSGLESKFGKYTDMVPTFLKDAASFLLVSPGTPHYQFLHSSTQYSDFSAKYVMFKHYSESATELMSPIDAMQMASDNFINYDVPSSPGMQYMNDMGLLMFTKYSLRIQKALFRLLAKRPAAAIGQAMLMDALTNLPPGIDPIVFNQYGIPFRDGALGLFDTWDEPFPIKMLF